MNMSDHVTTGGRCQFYVKFELTLNDSNSTDSQPLDGFMVLIVTPSFEDRFPLLVGYVTLL